MVSKIPIQLIAIENDGFHLMIEVLINNKKANLVLDTGASRTVFDKDEMRSFIDDETQIEYQENEKLSSGLGTNSMKSEAFYLASLKLGEFEINDYQALTLDLTHVKLSYESLNLPKIHGVLGGDLLKKFNAVIYYQKKILKLYQRNG
jgi:predicted aspartyl protease